jgi:hypothetical protein
VNATTAWSALAVAGLAVMAGALALGAVRRVWARSADPDPARLLRYNLTIGLAYAAVAAGVAVANWPPGGLAILTAGGFLVIFHRAWAPPETAPHLRVRYQLATAAAYACIAAGAITAGSAFLAIPLGIFAAAHVYRAARYAKRPSNQAGGEANPEPDPD